MVRIFNDRIPLVIDVLAISIGTPTELSPDGPDASISGDDKKINNFTFDQSKGQIRCPFAAHMRKSNPRNDVSPVESVYKHLYVHAIPFHRLLSIDLFCHSSIRRHNMPYGNEVTTKERDSHATTQDRGLHLVCYASSIVRGFKFYQQGKIAFSLDCTISLDLTDEHLPAWYNEPNFPPNKPELPGMDPIFGQTGEEHLEVHRYMTGANPSLEQEVMMFPKKFIDPKGGVYFFAPSLSTLRNLIAVAL